MMIKINSEKYIELFASWPDSDMILSGWEAEQKYFLGIPIYIQYTKQLRK